MWALGASHERLSEKSREANRGRVVLCESIQRGACVVPWAGAVPSSAAEAPARCCGQRRYSLLIDAVHVTEIIYFPLYFFPHTSENKATSSLTHILNSVFKELTLCVWICAHVSQSTRPSTTLRNHFSLLTCGPGD